VHDYSNVIEVELKFFRFDMIIRFLSLLHLFAIFNFKKILIEFFSKSFDSKNITLLIPKFGICLQVVIIFRCSLDFFFVLQDVSVKIVQGSLGWLSSMEWRWLKSLCWTQSSFYHLLILYSLKIFSPYLFFSMSIESIVSFLELSVIHHVYKLDWKTIEFWLCFYFLEFRINSILFRFEWFNTFIFQKSLLIVQKFI